VDNELVTIEGTIEEIIYSNEINGYTVCDIMHEQNEITAVGYMPFINVGETLKLTGKWVTHVEYGEQFKVEAYEKLMPKTLDGIEKYLASGIIKGVGPITANRIIELFAEDTIDVIQNHPEKLTEIKGISLDKAMKIGQAFDQQRELRNVVMFFQQYGISPNFSAKIYKTFGENTIGEIKTNPYKLADEVFGIGFKKADNIAKSIGIDPLSKFRVCSGIKYVLSQAASGGHTYLPEEKMKEYTSQLLDVKIENINDALVSLVFDNSIYVEKSDAFNKIYLSSFYYAEQGVCKKIIELAVTKPDCDLDNFEKKIKKIQAEEGIQLADRQKTAVKEALTEAILIITGGPGTGKTTIIKSIIKLLSNEGFEFALAAPTGRAAKRMSEATGFESKTIHRLLEIGYAEKDSELNFLKNEANPIEADVVIIDEMSMVDVLLMNHFLKAIAPGTRLILVGDTDQLPSVGAGNVLKDIIDSGSVKTIKLTDIFRQAEESMIIVNAHRINKGEYPHLNRKDKDFFFMPRKNGEDVLKTIIDLCQTRLPKSYGFEPLKHIQILTPTRKGIVGVTSLNIELQKVLNPVHKEKNEKIYGNYIFREGDRIMQVKNNYNLKWSKAEDPDIEGVGVFNGDTGLIQKVENEEQRITVVFEDEKVVEYDFSVLDEIEPAFAVTIHKSQGSEFPVVILPVYPGPQILMTRNLLYTGVTRAKSLVILVGMESTLNEMISNERETLRYSGLSQKIKNYFLTVF
jgi:exodeoxyribonuclease V alpha subunit